jgi:UDP-N-acetylglucosamine 2-epimerase (non-hydrolysing)
LVFAVHPSPAVRAVAEHAFEGCFNAALTEPLELPTLQNLLARSTLLLTDSGGLQEEATYLGIPTLVLREVTERPEGVAAGVLRMAGVEGERVRAHMAALLDDERRRRRMERASDVYGNGHAADAIAQCLDRLAGACK